MKSIVVTAHTPATCVSFEPLLYGIVACTHEVLPDRRFAKEAEPQRPVEVDRIVGK